MNTLNEMYDKKTRISKSGQYFKRNMVRLYQGIQSDVNFNHWIVSTLQFKQIQNKNIRK